MTAQTLNALKQRLTRGTHVSIADSFGQAKLRGKEMVVSSKGTVDCNGGDRCAGDWCSGLAVFTGTPESFKKDKKLAWRKGQVKICLTHLKDENGVLLVSPPLLSTPASIAETPLVRLGEEAVARSTAPNGNEVEIIVTWTDLAHAHGRGDIDRLSALARQLKRDNERLVRKTLAVQEQLIQHLTA